MALPRLQLFEFNDAPWAPAIVRDAVVEALSRALWRGHLLQPVVEPFAAFLERCGTREVLDLCAGAGGPAAVLVEELQRSGRTAPRFLLTDLFPHPGQWEELRVKHPKEIDYLAEPVDATHIGPKLGEGRARVIINALHHFPPQLARKILLGACENAPGVFIVEGLVRNPLRFLAFAPFGVAALLAQPFLARDRRWLRALLAWTGLGLVISAWDGAVSSMRCYTEAELRELVAPLGDTWRWEFGKYTFAGFGQGTWFTGVPTR